MIHLKKVEKVYRTSSVETLALNTIDLRLEKGEFVSVMGPSGSGKSTLLNIIGLLDAPTSGTVSLEGREITSYSDRGLAQIRNRKLGFIFQSYHLIGDLNVLDNVQLPLIYRTMSSRQRRKRAHETLEKVGLSARKKHFPSELSGGQKQRVAIARAIVGEPDIILADEPTGNLDSAMGTEIMNILLTLNRTEETTIVMVTHDEQLARQTERVLRLFDGSLVSEETQ